VTLARWGGVALAVLLGVLAALGQAPWGLWIVTLPALAGAFRLMAGVTPRRAALLGFALGVGYFGLALSWIVSPFFIEPEKYGWMAPFAMLFMAAGGGVFWGLAAWVGQRGGLIGLVIALTGVELARGYVLTGFPWALIGHVWIETPVAQLAAWVGPSGLTLWTCALAGLLAVRRWPQALAAVVMLGAAWGIGAQRLAQPEPAPSGITMRLVQPNASQVTKWDADLAQSHFDRLLRLSTGGPVDLVVWPETALPYLIDGSPELGPIIGGAMGGAPVALGLQRTEGVRAWNALAVVSPEGEIIADYRKHHLVPFGEYIPFGDLAFDWFGLSAFAAQQGHSYSAGVGAAVLDLGPLGKMLPLICYEAVFPQDLRAAPERADWILQVTNDAWFGTRSGPWQHLAQAQLRAIEQGLPLVRVANTGITAMIDARGRVTAQLPMGVEGALDAALPASLAAPPYARWGEWPVVLLLAGCALVAFRRQRVTAP
jgi:apolipoprotein N-acyltransferase